MDVTMLPISLTDDLLLPYQLIYDISLNLKSPPKTLSKRLLQPICSLETTNDWINLEALGKPSAIRAKEMAEALSLQMIIEDIQRLHLCIDVSSGHIGSDNIYSLIFLAEYLEKIEVDFIAPSEQHKAIEQLIKPLENQNNLTARIESKNVSIQNTFQAPIEKQISAKYALLKASGFPFCESWFSRTPVNQQTTGLLIGYAWTCMKTGASDLACRLLDAALNQCSLEEPIQELLLTQRHIIRFLSHQYRKVACGAFPERLKFTDVKTAQSLFFLKAYAGTLSRNLNVAQACFEQCGIQKDMLLSDEDSLYQLNLHALYLVLTGETKNAFACEMRIENFVKDNQIDVLGLKYVNFINIARLFKKTKQFELSKQYYEKAYDEIRGGGHTTSDHIYYNMNLGSLYEAMGEPHKALSYWLKASIHWLSMSNPYALSWRPRIILCQEKMDDILQPLSPEKASAYLYSKLSVLIEACKISLATTCADYHFYVSESNSSPEDTCYATNDIIVYVSTLQSSSSCMKRHDPIEKQLSRLTSQLLKQSLGLSDNIKSIQIESSVDNFSLDDKDRCAVLSSILGYKRCYYNGIEVNLTNVFDFPPYKALKLSLSKVIKDIIFNPESAEIKYKRSFMDKTLVDEQELSLIKQLSAHPSLLLKDLSPIKQHTISRMIAKRVISLT